MIFRVFADLVLIFHLAFIIFVVAGGLLALHWRWAPLVHLPAAIWGVFIEVSGGVCPLTPLENGLRAAAGATEYAGGFVEHYVVPIIYPAALSYTVQLFLAAFVLFANAVVYFFVWKRYRRGRPNDDA